MAKYVLDLNQVMARMGTELERLSDVKTPNMCILEDRDANMAAMRIARSLAIFLEKYLTEVNESPSE